MPKLTHTHKKEEHPRSALKASFDATPESIQENILIPLSEMEEFSVQEMALCPRPPRTRKVKVGKRRVRSLCKWKRRRKRRERGRKEGGRWGRGQGVRTKELSAEPLLCP